MKQAINIRLEKDVVANLDEYAQELNRTRTSLIEKAIELYFDKLDEMVADKRIDNLKNGKTSVVSLQKVFTKARINA
jgi:predicted transcriptional regulator